VLLRRVKDVLYSCEAGRLRCLRSQVLEGERCSATPSIRRIEHARRRQHDECLLFQPRFFTLVIGISDRTTCRRFLLQWGLLSQLCLAAIQWYNHLASMPLGYRTSELMNCWIKVEH